jgi:hypothetical protein
MHALSLAERGLRAFADIMIEGRTFVAVVGRIIAGLLSLSGNTATN